MLMRIITGYFVCFIENIHNKIEILDPCANSDIPFEFAQGL